MEFRFVKASPCRNTTVFVEDDVSVFVRARLARYLMNDEVLAAEQVGFLVPPLYEVSALRVEMAGDEFCGNASLALRALAVMRGLRATGTPFFVECSGSESPLRVSAESVAPGRWRGTVELSPKARILEIELSSAGVTYHGAIVELPGICHFCIESEPFSQETYDALLKQLTKHIVSDAYGIIPYRENGNNGFSICPYVAVPAAKSFVFEQACGSGSFALGLWLARIRGLTRLDVMQSGGTIHVEIGERPSISEEVYFPCAGIFFADEKLLRDASSK